MKTIRVLLLFASLLLGTSTLFAQGFTVFLYETDEILNTACTGGVPIPDGTPVQIMVDRGPAGESPEDTLARLCDFPPECIGGPPGTHNRNGFLMNGVSVGLSEGQFYMEEGFASIADLPNPYYKYYLKICLPGAHLVSDTMSFSRGYSEREVGGWTCVPQPCTGCPQPPTPTAFTASDNTVCTGVQLNWAYPDTATGIQAFFVYRDGLRIDSLPGTARTYLDVNANPQIGYLYAVGAKRVCGNDAAYSTQATDQGTRYPSPAVPDEITASENTCDSVRVFWHYTNNAGTDSFIIKRDGVRVGAVVVSGSPGNRVWYHVTSTRGPGDYTVVGRNPNCGEGTPSAAEPGEALQEPPQVVGVQATDGVCDSTVVTWTDVVGETSYHVFRANADGSGNTDMTPAGLPANTTRYRDQSGLVGITYRYTVVGYNQCGQSLASAFDNGFRVVSPAAPGNIAATDSVHCTHVVITWSDVISEMGYKVLRTLGPNTDTLATLGANITSYNDSTGLPGTVYTYTVRSFNDCGQAAGVGNAGSRRGLPPQVTTLTASDATVCAAVNLSWNNVTSESGYRILRNGVQIGSTNADVTTYSDTSPLTPGQNYGYAVFAWNDCGNGLSSPVDSGRVRDIPDDVATLTASDTSCTAVYLVWSNVAGEDNFLVYRGETLLATLAANDTDYVDTDAPNGLNSYYVTATNACGPAAPSPTVQGTRLPQVVEVPDIAASDNSCTEVLITWSDVFGESEYEIRRDGEVIATVAADQVSYSDVPPQTLTSYTYTVVGRNNCGPGQVAAGDAGARLAAAAQVQGVAASDDHCDNVVVTWTAQAFVDSFVVARDGAPIGAVAGDLNTLTDAAAVPGTVYSYTVTAYNVCGAGAVSAADAGQALVFPGVPQSVTGSTTLCDRVSLTWDAATGDVDAYTIYRGGDSLTTVAGDQTTYDDLTAALGDNSYTVAAVSNECGSSAQSAAAVGTRLETPGVPQGISVTTDLCTEIRLEWGAASGDVDGYRIYEDGVLLTSVDAGTLTYSATPAVPGLYDYTVTAFSTECGVEGDPTPEVTGALLAEPTTATGVTATTNRCDVVEISWTAGTGAIDGYIIRRDGTALDTVDADVLTYTDVPASGSYQYDVLVYSMNCTEPAPEPAVTGTRQPAPTPPTNVAATTDRCDSVVVTWTAATGTFDLYNLYRDGVLLTTLPAGETRFAEVTASGISFRYTVTAEDDICGETDSTAGASGIRTSDVGVPTDVTATGTCDDIQVAWTVATGAPEQYRVYRDGELLATVDASTTTYVDATAVAGVEYTYTVVAFTTECGETSASLPATGTRAVPPVQVADVTASSDDCDAVIVAWTEWEGADQYKIYRDGTLLDSVAAGVTTYSDATAVPGTTYNYTVAAENACGLGAESAAASGLRRAVPAQVTGVIAQDNSCGFLQIDWTLVPGATGYQVFRNDTLVAATNDTVAGRAFDQNPPLGTHAYTVRAINDCGDGALSAPDSGTRLESMPQVEFGSVSGQYCDRIELFWTDVAGEDGYHVFRNGEQIAELGPDVITYVDTNVPVGAHPYYIAAFNACGDGPNSITLSGQRRGAPEVAASVAASDGNCDNVVVTWVDIADELGYVVYRDDVYVGTVAADVTTITDLPAPGTYVYTVRSYNDCDTADAAQDQGTRLTTPLQVNGVAATVNRCDSVIVTWADLAFEQFYIVYRGAVAVDTLDANVLRFADAPAPGSYPYSVRAYNLCGVGQLSNQATGTLIEGPAAPAFIIVHDSCAFVYVQWGAAAGSVDAYRIFRGATMVHQTSADTTDYIYLDPAPAGTHVYTVRAWSNTCAVEGPPSPAANGSAHPAPGVPTNVQAAAPMCDSIRVTWTAATGEIAGYIVRRDNVIVDTVTATRYIDTEVLDDNPHNYTIASYNLFCGQSNQTAAVQGQMRSMLNITTDLPDTLNSGQAYRIDYVRCNNAQVDSVFLSRNNGPYTFFAILAAGQTADTLVMDTVATAQPNSRFRVVSVRGARRDTLTSDPFVIMPPTSSGRYVEGTIPTDFFLDQNYPNPFNPTTNIRFGVPRSAEVRIRVYDITGREVAVVHQGVLEPGIHTIVWDCSGCPTGMYVVRFETEGRVMLRKMLLMK